eukprot:1260431-Alexandrium_andersonii.AAC.1
MDVRYGRAILARPLGLRNAGWVAKSLLNDYAEQSRSILNDPAATDDQIVQPERSARHRSSTLNF